MGERKFVWDEFCEGISLLGVLKQEDEQRKSKGRLVHIQNEATIFCPHSYLVLNFQETFSKNEEIKFKKHYMRKISALEVDVILLQDIKNLVLYLISSPISIQFINFFHLPMVDRFLRALIIYFQFYIETWEELMQTRDATEKKVENPLSRGGALKKAEKLSCLRCILGKEYSNILIGCEDGARYHHMMAGEKPLIQSQHEKDLRIFETLIAVAHRVVWIALQRKYYYLIEVELHRLFRTDAFNTANRKNSEFQKNIKASELLELNGPNMLPRRKVLRNSPLPYQLLYSDCDFRLLALDSLNSKDPRIIYLQNALFLNEEKLPEFGIKVGILGMSSSNFNPFLMPHKGSKSEEKQDDEEKLQDQYPLAGKMQKQAEEKTIPDFGSDLELDLKFETEPLFTPSKRYIRSLVQEKNKWIERALTLSIKKHLDTPSATIT